MPNKKENWIWLPQWTAADKDMPVLVLFRKRIRLLSKPKRAVIRISADSRYKLYLDGNMVEMGPSRGDAQTWFYDEVDLLAYFGEDFSKEASPGQGEHVLAVQVLRYPTEHRKGNHGMFRTEHPGLFVKGSIEDGEGNWYCLDADESWRCKKDDGFRIVPEAEGFAPLQIFENRAGKASLAGWMRPGYEGAGWHAAASYAFISQAVSPGNLHPRTIPFLYRRDHDFTQVMAVRQTCLWQGAAAEQAGLKKQDWEEFLKGRQPLVIPAHGKEIVEISAGEEMTAYLHLCMQGGRGACIRILQSECYVQPERHPGGLPVKGRRDDWQNGHLEGFTDTYHVAGYGADGLWEEYEPFWFRTFRYIRLEIRTEEEPLILLRFYYTETGYPLEVRMKIITSDPKMEEIREISERSLRRCMHETYEDCPFYEQLQYAMDARLEILYTYAAAADDRLARKCMDDFRRSQRYDGLLNCSYPCYGPNIIPGFPVYYILMLHDHMMYFGDRELLEDHLPVVERILNFFHRRRAPEGYVMKLGGLNGQSPKWSFIDWTPEWDDTTGAPGAVLHGAVTMESLLYVMGLQRAADLAVYLGRMDLADIYAKRAEAVQAAVRKHCTGDEGMLTDGPGIGLYSQHVQVFAVLTHTVDVAQGKKNLERTLLFPEQYAQCSVAMAFYLFQALRRTGLYGWTGKYWEIWKRMLEKGLTTCVEDEVGERSDCHAWGALALYELPSVVLGVRPAGPGYGRVKIAPQPGHFKYASGRVPTPKGFIEVGWSLENGAEITYRAPEGLDVEIDATALKAAVPADGSEAGGNSGR